MLRNHCLPSGLVALSVFGFANLSLAADWGTLKGQFIDTATVPAPKKLDITKDQDVCTKDNPVDESIVVGKNNGLANVVVMLKPKLGEKVTVSEDALKALPAEVTLDNHGCRFQPHVVGMTTGQKLILKNSDPVGHNSKLEPFANAGSNPLIPAGQSVEQKFNVTENLPVKVTCSIHPWMNGWVVVRDNPYFAVSDADGKFEIKDIPTGEFDFVLWQEKGGYLKEIDLGGKKVTLDKGKLKQKIAAGANDLGEIKVDLK